MKYSTYKQQETKAPLTIPYYISEGLENCANIMQRVYEAMQAGQIELRYNLTQEVVDIITHLNALVPGDESEPAFNTLHNYFEFAESMMLKVNIKNDPEICKAMEKSFRDVSIAWRQAVDRLTTK